MRQYKKPDEITIRLDDGRNMDYDWFMKISHIKYEKEDELRSVNVKLSQDLKMFGKRQFGVLAQKHMSMPFRMIQL